ncbi:hypothetical protein [Paenibacillus montanisoli]|uniref:Uncharacterized protein n=1 Tax=Paenibacillus montanisoli TaxID=2081970 RepID=A0A328TWC4_9BACL|nr:hypothetical protein [Paenibacillus montanisoli]RAP74798.1 hypothetical protein DL346_22435 [Paenibacillus montanisoli]
MKKSILIYTTDNRQIIGRILYEGADYFELEPIQIKIINPGPIIVQADEIKRIIELPLEMQKGINKTIDEVPPFINRSYDQTD